MQNSADNRASAVTSTL